MATSRPDLIYELHIRHLSPEQIELTTAMLSFLEVEALEEMEDSIVLYHDRLEYLESLESELLKIAPWLSAANIVRDHRKNENWNKKWEASFDPIYVGDYCTVKASFHNLNSETKHVITIDPEMAFGTGHHETTFAMIEMMESLSFLNKTMLDYGSGTGILSILAEKEGAKSVLALDYDEVATECAENCVRLNGCKKVTCVTGVLETLISNSKFEIIVANINRNVLLENAKSLSTRQEEESLLLLSGIMQPDRIVVVEKFVSEGYQLENEIVKGEWLCLKMKRV